MASVERTRSEFAHIENNLTELEVRLQNSLPYLNENANVTSVKDRGTSIKHYLPLTLAIMDGMLIVAGEDKHIVQIYAKGHNV